MLWNLAYWIWDAWRVRPCRWSGLREDRCPVCVMRRIEGRS